MLWILLAGLPPGALRAQGAALVETAPPAAPVIPGPRPIAPALLGLDVPAAGSVVRPTDTLPCPDCDPPKRFWVALADLMVVQFIPFGVSNFITKEEWAKVSPQTWKNNFTYPWQWDDNDFQNNQFAHPYQGSAYYNSARTNGYDFWASSAWTLGGSLMWEYFFEAWAPAPNDLVNTVVGGIVLGEALNRASHLALDNTATGSERVWREIGGALLNPSAGSTGSFPAGPTPSAPTLPIGGPVPCSASWTWGIARRCSRRCECRKRGEPVERLVPAVLRGPGQGPGAEPVLLFQHPGRPGGTQQHRPDQPAERPRQPRRLAARHDRRHQLALSLEYDYFNNPAFEYSGQSAQLGVVTSIGAPGKTWWGQTQVLFNGVILGPSTRLLPVRRGPRLRLWPRPGRDPGRAPRLQESVAGHGRVHGALAAHDRRHPVRPLSGRPAGRGPLLGEPPPRRWRGLHRVHEAQRLLRATGRHAVGALPPPVRHERHSRIAAPVTECRP